MKRLGERGLCACPARTAVRIGRTRHWRCKLCPCCGVLSSECVCLSMWGRDGRCLSDETEIRRRWRTWCVRMMNPGPDVDDPRSTEDGAGWREARRRHTGAHSVRWMSRAGERSETRPAAPTTTVDRRRSSIEIRTLGENNLHLLFVLFPSMKAAALLLPWLATSWLRIPETCAALMRTSDS